MSAAYSVPGQCIFVLGVGNVNGLRLFHFAPFPPADDQCVKQDQKGCGGVVIRIRRPNFFQKIRLRPLDHIAMNGDLSLSKALGGLRIANPDDATDGTALRQAGRSDDPDAQSTNILYGSTPSTLSKQPHQDSGSSQQIEGDLESRELAAIMQNPNTLSPALLQSHSAGPSQEGNIRDSRRFHSTPQRLSGIPGVNNAVSMAKTAKNVENQYSTSPGGGAIPNLQSETQTSISSEDWKDRGAAVGIRREMDSNGRMIVRQVKKGVRDFSFGRVLGEGSYSTVFLATDRQTLKEYAIKVLEKRHIIKEKKIKYVNIEKNTLNRLTEHPGIVRLYYTFQDEMSLYYVLDLCNGGELLGVLKKTGTFDLDCTRFYGAQILDAIEYMHSRGVIHRDIKPENVLLNEQMHIKITDFGTAKLLRDPRESRDSVAVDREAASVAPSQEKDGESERAASFVGTAEYVSPELLTHKSSCKASDLWAFGCIIYQLLAGRPPFKAGSEYLTFQKIVNLEYEFPTGFPASARDLVERCLVLEPARRLTVEHIKNHEFFAGQQFGKSLWRAKAPRLRAFIPPAQEPVIIQLNGYSPSAGPSSTKADYSRSSPYPQPVKSTGSNRPVRIITELPPPTQLDIEWSPVLTRNNERILKLADLMVLSTPLPNSLHRKGSDEGHKKLSRFFGGSTTKKRQRLVMVTSSGRIVLAPAGGEEKRAKQELSLLASDSSWKTQSDAKGQPVWSVDTGGYHYTFEESKGSLISDGGRSSAEEWIETLDKARDMALSLSLATPGDDGTFGDMSSAVSSPSSTFGSRAQHSESYGPHDRTGRNHLSKSQGNHDDSGPRRNRFSKRQSRSGLGSAF